jgi:mannose-6-phosphate isomerase-like protein (cupin superfamily)
MKYVSKRWGYEVWITNGEKYCGKKLFVRQGKYCSFHWHEVKDEVLFIESGKIWMNYRKPEDTYTHSTKMSAGSAFHVEPNVKHQMHAAEDTMILEFSTQHFDEDSYRDTTDLVINNMPDEWERFR